MRVRLGPACSMFKQNAPCSTLAEPRAGSLNDVVERITRRLKSEDLLMEVEGEHAGFLPARPPSDISLAQVLAVFRGDDRDGQSRRQSPLTAVLADIELGTFLRTSQITLDQLVEPR